MTQEQFWNIFKEFVMFHPTNSDRPCLQLQSWALLKNFEANLNDDGLGMTMRDKGRSTFFSRKWAESGYQPNAIRTDSPILVANMIELATDYGTNRDRIDVLTFDLAVLDKLQDPKVRPTLCNGRNEQDLFRDAWEILLQVFTYLATIVEATVTPLAGAPYVQITSKQRLDALAAGAEITSFEINEDATRLLQRDFHKMLKTKEIKGLPWRGGIGNFHGIYVSELSMRFHECPEPVELNFVVYNREVNEQERCC